MERESLLAIPEVQSDCQILLKLSLGYTMSVNFYSHMYVLMHACMYVVGWVGMNAICMGQGMYMYACVYMCRYVGYELCVYVVKQVGRQ